MKKIFNYKLYFYCCTALLFLQTRQGMAQLTLTGQIRTRTEFRDGQGTLPNPNQTPSFFTSQRTRLNIGYTTDHLKFFTSIQDIRVWGMDASTISNMDGNRLMLHEGWGEIIFNDTTYLKKINNLSLKIGRQEIVYDDARVLGNLDWLQQGRRHDAAILKFSKGTFQADAGFAFNQNREIKNIGNVYNGTPIQQTGTDGVNVAAAAGTNGIGTMYKTMQYLYLAKEISFTRLTLLVFKDDFQKYSIPDPAAPTVKVYGKGLNSRVTTGLSVFTTIKRKHKLDACLYYQGNKDKDGNTLDAFMGSVSFSYALGRKMMLGPGADFLSGNNTNSSSKVNHRFDPLYGTPHKFWGFMDYFYVADPYGVNGSNALNPGLLDLYFKARYKLRDNLTFSVDAHEFFTGNEVADTRTPETTDKLNRRLGTELDFILQYNLTKQIAIEGGYSVMFGTNTLDRLKVSGTGAVNTDKRNTGNWAYVMINIRPDFFSHIYDKLKALTTQSDNLSKQVADMNNKQ